MTDTDEFLAHYGIKGMQWGVRKQYRADKKWEKGYNKPSKKLVRDITAKANNDFDTIDLPKINKGFRNVDIQNNPVQQRAYNEAIRLRFTQRMGLVIKEHYGKNPSGTKEVQIDDEGYVYISEVKHLDGSLVRIKMTKDSNGYITSVNITEEFVEAFVDVLEQDSMAQDALKPVDEFLAHYGIKGMRWGVRRELRRIAKADRRFEKLQRDKKLRRQLIQQAEEKAHMDLHKLEQDWEKQAEDFGSIKLMPTKYYSEAYDILNRHLDNLSREYTNASGTKRLKARYALDPSTGMDYFVVGTEDIEHSSDENEVRVPVTLNEKGIITKVEFPEDLFDLLLDDIMEDHLEQDGLTPTEEFLAHYGIKGMQWGVRRKRPQRAFATRVGQDSSVDETADEGKEVLRILAKQKKHGTLALTNHELRTINARLKLEQEFAKANPKPKGKIEKGHDFVKKTLAMGDTVNRAYGSYNNNAVLVAVRQKQEQKRIKQAWQDAFKPIFG